jgi:hypothetical protein
MRKISLLIALIIFIGWSAYALIANLFPDTVSFPRIPMTPGTMGYSIASMLWVTDLANYAGDGTAANSEKLWGISGTWYLKHKKCGGINVWLGVEPDGTPICWPSGSMLAYEIGTLTGVTGNITILKTDGTTSAWSNGDTLYNGDIVSTGLSSSGTIAFSDSSIIRLNEDTIVKLEVGENEDWDAIAQIILNNGDLWWRIITNTGMNVWAGGYIAWVRGTSVSVQKDGSNVVITVVDSTNNTNNAVKIYYEWQETTATNVGTGTVISVQSGTYLTTIPVSTPGKVSILTNSDWARDNTLSDMEYLMLLQNTALTSERLEKVENEFDVTTPKLEDTTICDAMWGTVGTCGADDNVENLPGELIGENLTPEQIDARKKLKAVRMICANKYGWVFWRTRGQCFVPEGVTNQKTIVFLADYAWETSANPINNPWQIPLPTFTAIVNDPITGVWWAGTQSPNFNPFLGPSVDLKGANIVIKPSYETSVGNTLQDNGNLQRNTWWWTEFINQGVTYRKLNLIALYTAMSSDGDAQDSEFYSNVQQWINTGYANIVIKNPISGRKYSWEDWWDYWQYDGISLEKELPISQIYTPGVGVTLDAAGEYITYPMRELWDLRGKTIRITLASTIPLDANPKVLMDLWTMRYYIKNNFVYKKIGTEGETIVSENYGNATQSLEFNLVIPADYNWSTIRFWNIIGTTLANDAIAPLKGTIKNISILQ